MAIVLDSNTKLSAEEAHLHFMPCKISHNGHAPVDRFFDSSVRGVDSVMDKGKVFTSAYRGRPLIGCDVEVPAGYTGYVLKESRRPFDEEEERNVKISHKFNHFKYWNLDRQPSANDKFQQALTWLDISTTVHSPMKEDSSSEQ